MHGNAVRKQSFLLRVKRELPELIDKSFFLSRFHLGQKKAKKPARLFSAVSKRINRQTLSGSKIKSNGSGLLTERRGLRARVPAHRQKSPSLYSGFRLTFFLLLSFIFSKPQFLVSEDVSNNRQSETSHGVDANSRLYRSFCAFISVINWMNSGACLIRFK